MYIASQNGHLPVVKQLLQEKVDTEAKFKKDKTPLLIASLMGHFGILQVLLDYGADPTVKTQHGDTPLMIATRKRARKARLLITSNSTFLANRNYYSY